MNRQDALQECLIALDQGVRLEDVLARYPKFAKELRPILETAEFVHNATRFSTDRAANDRSRTRMLAHAARLRGRKAKRLRPTLPRFALAAFTTVFIAVLTLSGLVSVSAQALPGDDLYGMKRSVEAARLAITTKAGAKRELTTQYKQRRRDETLALLELGRREEVTFEGTLTAISSDGWIVDGIQTNVDLDTSIDRPIEVGMGIQVTGLISPLGWIEARSIRVRSLQLIGRVQQIHDDYWIVDGRQLEVDELTQIDEGIEVLDQVIAQVYIENSGSITALLILAAEPLPTGQDGPPQTSTPPGDAEPVEFEGVVTSIAETFWTVYGIRFEVTGETVIEGDIQVGDKVLVRAVQGMSGAMRATQITRLAIEAEPTATPVPSDSTRPPGDEPTPDPHTTETDRSDTPPTVPPQDTPAQDAGPGD